MHLKLIQQKKKQSNEISDQDEMLKFNLMKRKSEHVSEL